MLFYAALTKEFTRTLCIQQGPKRLQPQPNKRVQHGKCQQEDLLVSTSTADWRGDMSPGNWNHKRPCLYQSENYKFTSVVQKPLDQEYNVHGLRLIVPPVSGRSNHKSFLQELSFSIQTHSNCKMALIVGFVSISEMMNSKRKMCIWELTEYYTLFLWLSTGMPFLPLDCHQVPRGLPVHCWSADLITLLLGLLCRQSYTLYRMTVLLFVYQPNNFFIFIILTLTFSLILLSCTSTTLNRNDASSHICLIILKECY